MSMLSPMSFNNQTGLIGLETKHRGVTLMLAWVIMMPVICFSILGEAPVLVLLAAVPLAISVAVRTPLKATTRALMYSLTISAAAAVLLRVGGYQMDARRFFLPASEIVPFLTGIAIAATFFRQTSPSFAIVLSASVLAFMLQGSILEDLGGGNTRLFLRGPFWQDRFAVFGLFVVLQMLVFVPCLRLAQMHRRHQDHAKPDRVNSWMRGAWLLSTLLTIAVTLGMVRLADPVYKQMDRVLSPILQWYIQRYASQVIFPSDKVSLHQTVDAKMGDHSEDVALRASSDQPPGYLRGRAYYVYADGTWHADDPQTPLVGSGMTDDSAMVAQRYNRPNYSVEEAATMKVRMDFYPTGRFYSDVLVVPGDVGTVELITEALHTNPDGALRPRRWDEGGAFTAYAPSISQVGAYESPTRSGGMNPLRDQRFLALPEDIAVPLTTIANQIATDTDKGKTTADIIRRTATYVRNGHDYELGVQSAADGPDPVLQFLTTTKRGHCEYFATATALLLRAQGVPTRYITGFVCFEEHPVDGVWISRFGDCHAWVEAYDSATDTWVLVESTPAAGLPDSLSRVSDSGLLFERLAALWGPFYAKVKRGYIAEAVIGMIRDFVNVMEWLYFGTPWPASWLVTLVVLALIIRRLRRFSRERAQIVVDPRQELRRSQRRFDALLRRYKIVRTPATSIRELAELVRQRQPPLADEMIAMLLDYERLRYTPDPPTADQVTDFDRRLADIARRTSSATAPA